MQIVDSTYKWHTFLNHVLLLLVAIEGLCVAVSNSPAAVSRYKKRLLFIALLWFVIYILSLIMLLVANRDHITPFWPVYGVSGGLTAGAFVFLFLSARRLLICLRKIANIRLGENIATANSRAQSSYLKFLASSKNKAERKKSRKPSV